MSDRESPRAPSADAEGLNPNEDRGAQPEVSPRTREHLGGFCGRRGHLQAERAFPQVLAGATAKSSLRTRAPAGLLRSTTGPPSAARSAPSRTSSPRSASPGSAPASTGLAPSAALAGTALATAPRTATSTTTATVLNRLWGDRWIGLEAFDHLSWNLSFEESLDVFQQTGLIDADQRDRLPLATCPPSASDPMNVVLRHIGKLEVHNEGKLVNIQAAGSNVRGHQDMNVAVLEAGEGPRASVLALVAMNGSSLEPFFGELLS